MVSLNILKLSLNGTTVNFCHHEASYDTDVGITTSYSPAGPTYAC
jgi:hypothetical protein